VSEETFVLPDVGEGLTEAEIVEWKVAVGDTVSLNQPLVDIETAKATVELPSPFAGTVARLRAEVGDVVEVGKPLIDISTDGATGAAPATAAETAEAGPAEPTESEADDGENTTGRTAVLVGYGVASDTAAPARRHRRRGGAPTPPAPPPPAATPASAAPSASPRSTPPVRLYAKQHGLDISTVAGSGPDGLITRADVDGALAGGGRAPSRPIVATPSAPTRFVGHDLAPWSSGPAEERIPVRGVLRSMSEAMVKSAFTAPHAAAWLRVDATRTVELLAALRERPALSGVRVSPLTITAMALCDAARTYPGINSSFDTEANEVVVRRSVALGIAADTPRGLVVPNVKGADTLDVVAMANAITAIVDKARAGSLAPADMLGTTLTITNVGPFGVDGAFPILPPGTSAIIALGQLVKAPWVVNDEVVVRHVVEIGIAFDHRLIDGALASNVLAHIGRYLNDPAPSLIAP
jgi:pyruvate dehydrogenase E2 component (dihydrolipoamide acetyltransferase)